MPIDFDTATSPSANTAFYASAAGTNVGVFSKNPDSFQLIRVLKALRKVNATITITSSPPQAFSVEPDGTVLYAVRPYTEAVNKTIDAIAAFGDVTIPPRFDETAGDKNERIGSEYGGFFMANTEAAVVCTATPNVKLRIKPLCISTMNKDIAVSLRALHDWDAAADEKHPRVKAWQALAKKNAIYTPDNLTRLTNTLNQPYLRISTAAAITDPDALKSLASNAATLQLVVTDELKKQTWVETLRIAGAKVFTTPMNHGGLIVDDGKTVFLGSWKLQPIHYKYSRQVGIAVSRTNLPSLDNVFAK
jgi:hypothetical protein